MFLLLFIWYIFTYKNALTWLFLMETLFRGFIIINLSIVSLIFDAMYFVSKIVISLLVLQRVKDVPVVL